MIQEAFHAFNRKDYLKAFELFKNNLDSFCVTYNMTLYKQYLLNMNIEKHSQIMNNMALTLTDNKNPLVDNVLNIYGPTELNLNKQMLIDKESKTKNTLANSLLYISSKNTTNKQLNIIIFACRNCTTLFTNTQRLTHLYKKCTRFIYWLITPRTTSKEQTHVGMSNIYTSDLTQEANDINFIDIILQGYKSSHNRPSNKIMIKYFITILKICYHVPFDIIEICSIMTMTALFQ